MQTLEHIFTLKHLAEQQFNVSQSILDSTLFNFNLISEQKLATKFVIDKNYAKNKISDDNKEEIFFNLKGINYISSQIKNDISFQIEQIIQKNQLRFHYMLGSDPIVQNVTKAIIHRLEIESIYEYHQNNPIFLNQLLDTIENKNFHPSIFDSYSFYEPLLKLKEVKKLEHLLPNKNEKNHLDSINPNLTLEPTSLNNDLSTVNLKINKQHKI